MFITQSNPLVDVLMDIMNGKKDAEKGAKAIKKVLTHKATPAEIKQQEELIRKANDRFDWLIRFLICRYHFVQQVLGMMEKKPAPGFGTLGVTVQQGGKFTLVYDPLVFNALTDAEGVYIFFHEVLHVVLHHSTCRAKDNHTIWNYAIDCAANQLIPIDPGSCEMPRDKDGEIVGVHVDELKKKPEFKDILDKQTAEWYYDFFLKHMPKQSGKGKGKGQPGEGQPGDGEGDPQSGDGSGQSELQKALDKVFGKLLDNHAGHKEDELADERVRAKVKEIDGNKMWGSVPQTSVEVILAAQSVRINWRNLIRQFYGNMAWHEREGTRKRPNRRTGYVHPGYKKVYVDRHLVAVDTSGSVGSELLAEFLQVINSMTEYVPIDVMQFDCEKTEEPKPFDKKRTSFEFKGRGGTDFQPVIDTVDKMHYKSVLILTDGAAPAPTQPRARVLWVLPENMHPPVTWGQEIHMTRYA